MDGKKCTTCLRWCRLDCFYKKGLRLDSRCKKCVLRCKAKSYRKAHPRVTSRTVVWKEVFETVYDGPPTLPLEPLLRDFVMDIILNDDPP